MNIVFYVIFFILGSVFGSFISLATYRIPLNQDIIKERSYCPKCNHKLGFFDMIPILSFIFLGGKCKYCKNKIGLRYITFEILCGFAFVFLAYLLKFDVYHINTNTIIEFIIGILYIVFLFLVAGIDLEHNKIDKRVLVYGITIALINIVYQYIYYTNMNLEYNLKRIIIYLIVIVILNVINISRTKNNKNQYIFDLVNLALILNLFTYEYVAILTIICTLIAIAIRLIIVEKPKKKGKSKRNIPIAFFATISNVIVVIISLVYSNFF